MNQKDMIMEQTTFIDRSVEKDRVVLNAARISIAGAAASLAMLAAVHILKPEFDPSWRMVSEYAIGDYGWVMKLGFICMALACAALFFAIRPYVKTVGGKIGLGFLLATCFGMAMAGVFAIDPITGSADQITTHGSLHGLASLIGVPSFPIAAILISVSLGRNPAVQPFRRLRIGTALLILISLIWMVATIAVLMPSAGGFGPSVILGWPNRVLFLAYGAWLITTAWSTISRSGE